MKKEANCLNCNYSIAIIEFSENHKSLKTNYKVRSNELAIHNNEIRSIIKCKCSCSNLIILKENDFIQEFNKMKIK